MDLWCLTWLEVHQANIPNWGWVQVGAMTHRAALPPLLPFNLTPDEHFVRAIERAQQPLPYEDCPVVITRICNSLRPDIILNSLPCEPGVAEQWEPCGS